MKRPCPPRSRDQLRFDLVEVAIPHGLLAFAGFMLLALGALLLGPPSPLVILAFGAVWGSVLAAAVFWSAR